jgi:hypothetical protein
MYTTVVGLPPAQNQIVGIVVVIKDWGHPVFHDVKQSMSCEDG